MNLLKRIKAITLWKKLGGIPFPEASILTEIVDSLEELKSRPMPEPKQLSEKEIVAFIKPLIPPKPHIPIKGVDYFDGKDSKITLNDVVDELRPEVLSQLRKHGGGGPNRQISINSSVIGIPWNDFNYIGSIVGVPNSTTQKTDIYFSGGGGIPASPDTSVQYNNGGNFGGTSLEYDKAQEPNAFFKTASPVSGSANTIFFQAGDALDGISDGGAFGFGTGSSGAYTGSSVSMNGGSPGDGVGGPIYFTAGNAVDGNGAQIKISGGIDGDGGGDIYFRPGGQNGGHDNGFVQIQDPVSILNANLDTSLISSSDKTSQFPNYSGILQEWVTKPAAANSTGTAGMMSYESGFLYICIATNTWQRVAIATW